MRCLLKTRMLNHLDYNSLPIQSLSKPLPASVGIMQNARTCFMYTMQLARSSGSSPARNEIDQHHDQRNHQQDMDYPSDRVTGHQTKQPQNNQTPQPPCQQRTSIRNSGRECAAPRPGFSELLEPDRRTPKQAQYVRAIRDSGSAG